MPNPNGGFFALCLYGTAYAAPAGLQGNPGLCALIVQMQSVFKTLRVLAFVGAGFMIAKHAWDAIVSGKVGGADNALEGLKKVGIPMIVGLTLLFSIGILMGFLANGNNFGCSTFTSGW